MRYEKIHKFFQKKIKKKDVQKKRFLQTKELLKKTYMKIESHDDKIVTGKVGYHCRRCDFNNKCHFYRNNDDAY